MKPCFECDLTQETPHIPVSSFITGSMAKLRDKVTDFFDRNIGWYFDPERCCVSIKPNGEGYRIQRRTESDKANSESYRIRRRAPCDEIGWIVITDPNNFSWDVNPS